MVALTPVEIEELHDRLVDSVCMLDAQVPGQLLVLLDERTTYEAREEFSFDAMVEALMDMARSEDDVYDLKCWARKFESASKQLKRFAKELDDQLREGNVS